MMIATRVAVALFVSFTSLRMAAEPLTTTLYVSTLGNDANPGTAAKPLASLDRARDVIRSLRQKNAQAPMAFAVMIAGGDYRITHTFALEAQDSGAVNAPITYRAVPGEAVHLVGGQSIPGAMFAPVADSAILNRLPESARDKVMQVNLKAQGITEYGQIKPYGFGLPRSAAPPDLFVDGDAMILARWPNSGWVKIKNVIDRGSVWGSNVPGEPELREKPERGAAFELPDDRLDSWVDAKEAWLYGYWWWDWADSAVKIDRIDPAAHLIKTAQPHVFGFRAGGYYYAFNLLEEIDAPGEWYLDRQNGTLYLYPTGPLASSPG
jgi:hypothetical protein